MRKRPPATHKGRMTQAWKGTRPTSEFSDYDQYYINLAMTIHELLAPYFHLLSRFGKEETEQNRLCVVLVSYFEDYISEVDLWPTFRAECQESLGQDLPFHDLAGYDPDYINRQDIALLIWVWGAAGFTSNLIDPQHRTIMILAETMYALMEQHIEEAPATSTFDDLLTIEDENQFFELRNIMVWLYSNSWLYGMLDMRMEFELEQEETIKEMQGKLTQETSNLLHYELSLDYAINRTSRWGGARMGEVAARLIKGNQDIRNRLKNMPKRIMGNFKIVEKGEQHHTFQHTESLRKIQVNVESIDLKQFTKTDITTGVIRWGDEYWVSGSMALTKDPKSPEDSLGHLPWALANDKERQEMHTTTAEQEKVFLEQFGARLFVCKDRKDCEAAMTRYYTALENFNAKEKGREPNLEDIPKTTLKQMPPGQQVAMFFTEGQGIHFSLLAAEIIDYVNGGEFHEFKSDAEAVMAMVGNCDLPLVKYLAANYPMEKFSEAVSFIDFDRDLVSLCWFLNPVGSQKPVPNMTIVNLARE